MFSRFAAPSSAPVSSYSSTRHHRQHPQPLDKRAKLNSGKSFTPTSDCSHCGGAFDKESGNCNTCESIGKKSSASNSVFHPRRPTPQPKKQFAPNPPVPPPAVEQQHAVPGAVGSLLRKRWRAMTAHWTEQAAIENTKRKIRSRVDLTLNQHAAPKTPLGDQRLRNIQKMLNSLGVVRSPDQVFPIISLTLHLS